MFASPESLHSAEARKVLADALERDAAAHDAGDYDRIAKAYDDVLTELLPIQDVDAAPFGLAFDFWDGWSDSRNHQWLYYQGIARSDWPRLARHVAAAIRNATAITDPLVLEHFGRPRRSLWQWLRDLVRGKGASA